jgi:hypothetical protein
MASSTRGKNGNAGAKKPVNPDYLGLFRVLMTDDPRLTPETLEEANERKQSEYDKRLELLYHGTVIYRVTYQFIPANGIKLSFAPMTTREFAEFCLMKSDRYIFERGKDSHAYVKLYRRTQGGGESNYE